MDTNDTNRKIIYKELSYKICGLCYDVHNELGRFRNEKQYSDAFEQKLKENSINYKREHPLEISFPGELPRRNIVDFLIDDSIILDLKAKRIVTKEDYFQMQRYLSSAHKKLGIIVNFKHKYLTPKRIINNGKYS